MHDIKSIRENPEAFDAGLARRGVEAASATLLKLDEERRASQTQLQEMQSQRNALAKQVGQAKAKGENADELLAQSKKLAEDMAALEARLSTGGELEDALAKLPNIPDADVPDGKDENDNKQVRIVGEKPVMNFTPKLHDDLGVALGLMDFESAAKVSGARFVYLKGALARMERALASFMLDIHTTEFGYSETVPPLLVKDNAVYGTGQLPKFAEDLFHTDNGFWLIPTAEVSLTNLVNDSIIPEDQLPMRLTAFTPCFRSEAGAAGKDTRGMIRQHQFGKVELVSITKPEDSKAEHERMTACAEEILKRLGLHYRVMLLCTGDMGFGAEKTYDIEVWMPGQDTYREISSCSNCGAFQARRMKARFKRKEGKPEAVHTLNGSGLPTGRTMVAILENYQQEDGSIKVPEALRPYMGGLEVIAKP